MSKLTVALAQMNTTGDLVANRQQAQDLIAEAAANGADIVMTPEVTNLIAPSAQAMVAQIVPEDDDETLRAIRDQARALKIQVLIGSLALRGTEDERAVNRSFLIGPDGAIVARYDKIHMFRADLPGGASYDEAKNYRPGERAVVAQTPFGGLGMAICYDLRFPYLFRTLAQAGASMLAIPAAFTRPTGEAHWHVLMRARAIETGCFVLAPAQWGPHGSTEQGALRESYGHSLIVSPWGEVIADGGAGVGLTMAEIDLDQVAAARASIPSLSGDRSFQAPK